MWGFFCFVLSVFLFFECVVVGVDGRGLTVLGAPPNHGNLSLSLLERG